MYEIFEINEHLKNSKNTAKISRLLADYFINQTKAKTFMNDEKLVGLYIWNGKRYIQGVEIAEKFLNDMHKFNQLDDIGIKLRSLREDFLHHVNFSFLETIKNSKNYISFNNFVFDWSKFEDISSFPFGFLKGHDHEIHVFNYINHDIDTEPFFFYSTTEFAKLAELIAPKTVEIFQSWVGEKWVLLFEIIGYCLYPNYVFNKAIMLIGSGANGKSTYLRLLKEILGKENIASISLQSIAENPFSASELYNKLANIYADLPKTAIKMTGQFKILTGEDWISADRKFKSRISFENYAKLLFSANELPHVSDMTDAFWRRWLVIKFPNKFEPIPDFFENNFDEIEISKIISLSLIAFKEVLKRGKFSFEETSADYKEIWLRQTNSVYSFIQDMLKDKLIIKELGAKEEKAKVYQKYIEYCDFNDITPIEKNTFTKRLETMGFNSYMSHGKTYYKNLKLNDPFKSEFDDLREDNLKDFELM